MRTGCTRRQTLLTRRQYSCGLVLARGGMRGIDVLPSMPLLRPLSSVTDQSDGKRACGTRLAMLRRGVASSICSDSGTGIACEPRRVTDAYRPQITKLCDVAIYIYICACTYVCSICNLILRRRQCCLLTLSTHKGHPWCVTVSRWHDLKVHSWLRASILINMFAIDGNGCTRMNIMLMKVD